MNKMNIAGNVLNAAMIICVATAYARVEKPIPDVFFLPLSQQQSSVNIKTPDESSRLWYYVGGSTLTAAGTMERVNSNPGYFEGTYAFRGNSDNGTVLKQVAGSLTEMSAMTVAVWLNYDSESPAAVSTPICAYHGFYLNLDDGSSWGAVPDAGGGRYVCFTEFNVVEYGWRSTRPVLPVGEWHHVAVTVERDGAWTKPTVYLDGVEIEMEDNGTIGSASRTAPASLAGTSLCIGNIYNTTAAGVRPFDGLVSDIRVYSSILTHDQIVMLTKSDAELNHAAPDVSLSSTAQFGHVTNTVEVTANAKSSNPDPASSLTYLWRKVSGPGAVWFDTQADRSSAVVFSAPGAYVLDCVVSDGVYSTNSPPLALQVDTTGKLPHPDVFFPVRADSVWSVDDAYYLFRVGNSSCITDVGTGKLSGTRALQLAGAAGECYKLVKGDSSVMAPFQADPQFVSVSAWVDGDGMSGSADNAWLLGKYNVFDVSLYKGAGGTSWPVDGDGRWYVKFSHGRTDTSGNRGMGFKTWCSVSPAFAANGWRHVAATFCRTNGWNSVPRVWVDGVELEMSVFANQTTGSLTALDYLGKTFIVGNNYDTVNAGVQYFGGRMSDLRIMFREIGAGEAKRLAGFVPKHGMVLVFR